MRPVLCPVVVGRDDELRLLAEACPFGEHAFYMILEGDSSESVIADLPPEWRAGTRAIPLELFKLPS